MKSLSAVTMFFKGGASGPPPGSTVVSSPPPPTVQSVEVQMAQRDAAKKAAKQRGLNKTILAGETGGYNPPDPTTILGSNGTQVQKKTLLGG